MNVETVLCLFLINNLKLFVVCWSLGGVLGGFFPSLAPGVAEMVGTEVIT